MRFAFTLLLILFLVPRAFGAEDPQCNLNGRWETPFLVPVRLVAAVAKEAHASRIVGSLTSANCDPTVRRGGKTIRLQEGDLILRGDLIRCGKGGAARVTFANGNRISMGPKAELRVDEFVLKKENRFVTILRLIQGAVVTDAEGDLEIGTDVADVGIRGTKFKLEYLPERPAGKALRLQTVRGVVYVRERATGKTTDVPAGASFHL